MTKPLTSHDWARIFATNMRAARENEQLHQGGLAALLSSPGMPVTQQKIARMESGERKITIGEAHMISRALGLPLDELLEEFFAPPPSLAEALRLIKADESTLTPIELRQRDKAVALLESYAKINNQKENK